jgi:D-threo-aldose 1-dehydrogenase
MYGRTGSAEAYDRRFSEAMAGAYRALDELRRTCVIKAIGVGINEVAPCVRFSHEGSFDCFLLAGRYTLLEQNGLDDLFPLAERQGFSLLLGGPFNSGILASGARNLRRAATDWWSNEDSNQGPAKWVCGSCAANTWC